MNHLLAPESDQVEKIDKVIYQALHLQRRMVFITLSHQIHPTSTLPIYLEPVHTICSLSFYLSTFNTTNMASEQLQDTADIVADLPCTEVERELDESPEDQYEEPEFCAIPLHSSSSPFIPSPCFATNTPSPLRNRKILPRNRPRTWQDPLHHPGLLRSSSNHRPNRASAALRKHRHPRTW